MKSYLEEYRELFDKYQESFKVYYDALVEEEDKECEGKKYDEKETAFIRFKTQVLAWIRQMEHE